ncbi:conserved protein of unknown function [Xenorhabdus doucetiae]|uniref:Phage regulatory protein CII n=1 Tax=Xenorhabdus doucetiae TaxID=351671 RepID=A0A068QV76_9GAMM|nr:phage regulatory CII family protein [Xenorhabdus doucetiae]TYO94898.1 phage regulatory protein CII [Xenorhabdus doucetiae]CDG18566.1 conserved protein of unknown function [Xenorhabdus doucetiae]
MIDCRVSQKSYFDNAYCAFFNTHNGSLVQDLELVGLIPQILRNKFNPEQHYMLVAYFILFLIRGV